MRTVRDKIAVFGVLASVLAIACGGGSKGDSAKEITSFAFLAAGNPGLAADVTGVITDAAIALSVPNSTNVSALVPTFATTGAIVIVGASPQVSGSTAADFRSPVTYKVIAKDKTSRSYTVTVTVAPGPAKEIKTFAFLAANNSGLSSDAVGVINGTVISVTVPSGTGVAALVATFTNTGSTVTVGTAVQTSGVTPNDFANPVLYTVTAVDGSTKVYTVTVNVAPSSAKEITSFAFEKAHNAGLSSDVAAAIAGSVISVTVPSGTGVTALVATFATSGATVSVGAATQMSGVTANNFTAPVTYTVTAVDGSTKAYTVTVTVAASSAKEITSFEFLSVKNAGLSADVTGVIAGSAISVTVPNGTDVTALVATFATTGVTVKATGGTTQVSGVTLNNFTAPVTYTVTAADNSTKAYVVTVTVALNSAKEITSFAFLSVKNPVLAADVAGVIVGTSISVNVPSGTNVTALMATFATSGVTVKVGATAQTSDVTANDFTNAVTYTVTAADNSTKDYVVTVTVAASSAKEITSFEFLSVNNPGLSADVAGVIAGTSIGLTVPNGTAVTALVATFATSGATVKVGAAAQTSGVTANNFTSPVTYTVTAADNSTKDYVVTVTVAPSAAKEITTFDFLSANNAGLSADVVGGIVGTAVSLTVPNGTDVTALVATFATSGATVKVGAAAQTSGVTANNFTSPVTYTVTAADNSTKDYVVTVTVAPSAAKEITTFDFLSANNAGLSADVVGGIVGTAVSLTVPNGTDVTALVATFATSGATVKVGAAAQTSGVTANNFTSPVTYTVTAADNSTKDYVVTVTVAPSSAKDITSFEFLSVNNAGLSADVTGVITGSAIALTVPSGTNVTALAATFATSGATVKVGAAVQTSGSTANNFAAPVTYTVTAADNSTKDYTVTVTVALSTAKDITSFTLLTADNPGLSMDATGVIVGTAITVTISGAPNVTALIATFATSGASVKVGVTVQTSGVTVNDFTNPVTYTVTAADNSTKDYTITVMP